MQYLKDFTQIDFYIIAWPSRLGLLVRCLHCMNRYRERLTNAENLSVYPATILRGEESNDTSNIKGLADTVERRPGLSILVDFVVAEFVAVRDVLPAHSVVHVGLDAAGSDAVDGDLLVTAVNSHAAHKGLDGTLGAGIDGVLGDTLCLAGDGAHKDDATTLFHVLVCLAGDEELAAGVNAHDAVILLFSDVLQVAEGNDARVGAADVNLAEVLNGLVEERDGLGDVGDVGLDGNGIAAHVFDLGNYLVGSFAAVGIVDNHLCTAASELKGHLFADSTAWASLVTRMGIL